MNRLFTTMIRNVGLGISIVTVVIIGCFFIWRLFTVDTVTIHSGRDVITDTRSLQQYLWLPTVDINTLAQQLSSDNPLARDITITKQYPTTLIIRAQERSAIAAVRSDIGFLIVDSDGVVIATDTTTKQLPVITSDRVTIGKNRLQDTIILKSIQIVSNSYVGGFRVSQVTVSTTEQLITIIFDDGMIIFPASKSVDYLFASLQFLLPQFRIEGKQPVVLDFRFDKPVIR